MTFRDEWPNQIWQFVKDDFASWGSLRPLGQKDGALGCHYGSEKLKESLTLSGELRNACRNLAWTAPLEMSPLAENVSFEIMKKFALATWCDKDGKVSVPDTWLRGMNIPIAVFPSRTTPTKAT